MKSIESKFRSLDSLFRTVFEVTKHQIRLKNPGLSDFDLHIRTIELLHNIKINLNEKHS